MQPVENSVPQAGGIQAAFVRYQPPDAHRGILLLEEVDLGAMGLFVGNVTGSDAGGMPDSRGVVKGL